MSYDNDPIRIEGLSPVEKWYMDVIWNIQSEEELNEFKDVLPSDQRAIVEKLQTLLFMEALDQDLVKKKEFPIVNDYLKRFHIPQ